MQPEAEKPEPIPIIQSTHSNIFKRKDRRLFDLEGRRLQQTAESNL